MRSDELLARVRMSAFIGDVAQFPDYSNAWILNELNDQMNLLFTERVVKARGGYWLKQVIQAITSGTPRYPIPYRSVTGGLERLDIADSTLDWAELSVVDDLQAQAWDLGTGLTGSVSRYVPRGDQIQLLPVPDATVASLRFSYYVRPSRLVTSQSSTLAGAGDAVVRGQITAINTGTRAVTVNVVPFDQELGTPAAITSALQRIDIVRPTGWHELQLVNATQTLAGSVFTVGGTDPLTDVQVGDYVRVAEQTDWACLPDDFHRCLCDAAAVKILTQLAWFDKAGALVQQLNADLNRFTELITPRIKESARDIVMPVGIYQPARRYANW